MSAITGNLCDVGICGIAAMVAAIFHVAADGPELRRMYALAGELNVPILVHFQEVGHTPTEGTFSTGWKKFAATNRPIFRPSCSPAAES